MSYQVKYLALDGRPAVRETHTDETAAHHAAGFQSERTGLLHWVSVEGVVCMDCLGVYEDAKIKAGNRPYVPGSSGLFKKHDGTEFSERKQR